MKDFRELPRQWFFSKNVSSFLCGKIEHINKNTLTMWKYTEVLWLLLKLIKQNIFWLTDIVKKK